MKDPHKQKLQEYMADGFAPPEHLNVWQWNEKYVELSSRVTPHPGPYRSDWCPYVREPQENLTNPDVPETVLCWASRSSKTETIFNGLRYFVGAEPRSMMAVFPNKDLGKEVFEERFMPSVYDCPELRRELPTAKQRVKLKKDRMHFRRCTMTVCGANSPAGLSSRGVTILYCDEIDKWKEATKKFTGALQQALERTKDRWNRKHIFTSTPTIEGGQIWKEFLDGDQRYYFMPCPHCGEFQRFEFKQLKFDDAKVGDIWNFELLKKVTHYECINPKCQKEIRDHHKDAMLKAGQWKATAIAKRPGRRSYHLSSIYAPWIPFHEVAAMFLASLDSPEDKQRFINDWLAEPYYMHGDQREQEARLMEARGEEPAEGVPSGHVATIQVDVQADRIYFEVRAWDRDRNSLQLDYGCLPGLEEAEIVKQKWKCFCGFVDARFRQQTILEWCCKAPRWIPVQGTAGLFSQFRWRPTPIDGGLMKGRTVRVLCFRPDDFREELFRRLEKKGPVWKIRPDVSEDYKKQMLGERRVERRGSRGRTVVEYVKIHANHYYDVAVMGIAGFESIRSFAFEVPSGQEPSVPPMPAAPALTDEHRQIQEARMPRSDSGDGHLDWS